jgi:signal transduction histidine kinase
LFEHDAVDHAQGRIEMAIRPLLVLLPVALSLGLVACDSRDYEAESVDLQTQLGDANGQLETLRTENQGLSDEMAELRTQAEQAATAAGNLGEEAAETIRTQLGSALDKASQTVDRLAALEREPDAPAEARTEAVSTLRSDVQEIVDSVQAAASELGLELQTGVEPAAGATEPPAAPAAGEAQPPAPDQPADQPAQPQQQ